jgi:alkylated DNA repair dioxygenase AlkB
MWRSEACTLTVKPFRDLSVDLFDDNPLQLPGAELQLHTQWLDSAIADDWLNELNAKTPWQQPHVQIYGRQLPVPRLVAWYGDAEASYRYSGLTHQPLPWTPLLAQIRAQVEVAVGQPLNGVLLNYYRDGQDSMGWHSDDEAELGANPLVASLNLGGTRRFDLGSAALSIRCRYSTDRCWSCAGQPSIIGSTKWRRRAASVRPA